MANESLKAKLEAYEAACAKSYAKTPERAGLKHNKVYTPLDIEGFDYERDLGIPGDYPYTRGVQPTMYRGRLWTMRMYAGFATAEESNKRYRYLIENGAPACPAHSTFRPRSAMTLMTKWLSAKLVR